MFWFHSKHLLRLSMFRTIVHKYIVAFSIVCWKIISRVDYNPIMTGTKLSAVLKFHFWPSTRRYLQPRSETGSWKKYTQLNTAYRDLLSDAKDSGNYSLALLIKLCMSFCEFVCRVQGSFPFSLCCHLTLWLAILSAVSLFTKISSTVKFFKWPQ